MCYSIHFLFTLYEYICDTITFYWTSKCQVWTTKIYARLKIDEHVKHSNFIGNACESSGLCITTRFFGLMCRWNQNALEFYVHSPTTSLRKNITSILRRYDIYLHHTPLWPPIASHTASKKHLWLQVISRNSDNIRVCSARITWWRHQMETFSSLLALYAGIHRSPVNSPHKGQWRGALMLSLINTWINGWVNNREADDLRRHRVHYDVIVIRMPQSA